MVTLGSKANESFVSVAGILYPRVTDKLTHILVLLPKETFVSICPSVPTLRPYRKQAAHKVNYFLMSVCNQTWYKVGIVLPYGAVDF